MPIPIRLLLPLALTSAALLAGAAFLMAAPAPTSPAALTPQQVADTLDGIVQPRFQQNAGRFGVDRVLLDGHDEIYGLSAVTARERRDFRRANAAHRPYVVAFLHCAHKPGHYSNSKERADGATDPSLEPLASATTTEDGAEKLRGWADEHLEKVVLPDLADLRRGGNVDKDFGNWRVCMRPVLASRPSCLGCHVGAKKNDTLGVMVYAVDKNTVKAPVRVTNEGLQ